MKTATIEVEGVGFVLLERSRRAKHLNISIKPFAGVRVAVPFGLSFKKAENIVHSKRSWVKKHLDKMKKLEQEHKSRTSNLADIDKAAAKIKLVDKLNELAKQHGFTYNRVFIRNQKTRWGSCSAKNNINLNIKLLNLPEELIDYVILHELVHTLIKNHSKDFWTELNKLVPDPKALRTKLKKYHLLYYAAFASADVVVYISNTSLASLRGHSFIFKPICCETSPASVLKSLIKVFKS